MTTRIFRLGLLVSAAVFSSWGVCRAGDNPADTPALHLEESLVVPHGNTVNFYNVPAVGPDGVKSYDFECHFTLGTDGTVKLDATKATLSPVLSESVHRFVAGVYVCVAGDRESTMTVTGPVIAPDGRGIWTFVITAGVLRGGGVWTTGPVEGHPQLRSIPKETVLPKGYTFGNTVGGDLIVVEQLGDKIIMAMPRTFTNENRQIEYVVNNGFIVFQKKPEPAE